jgi:hypothetical protein
MEIKSILNQSILRLLKPLVKILLTHGISVNEFMSLVKRSYVEVADQEFKLEGRKQTVSRIAVITGMHRKDVTYYRNKYRNKDFDASQEPETQFHNRAARVISAWITHTEFLDAKGETSILPIEGEKSSFSSLVLKHSGSMTVRAMLDEMIRVGAIEFANSDSVKLIQTIYVPKESDAQRIIYMGDASSDLLNTLSINLETPEANRLQLSTAFDNLPEECLPELKKICHQKSTKLLNELEFWLSKQDRDSNATIVGTGRVRAGLGIYYLEETIDE